MRRLTSIVACVATAVLLCSTAQAQKPPTTADWHRAHGNDSAKLHPMLRVLADGSGRAARVQDNLQRRFPQFARGEVTVNVVSNGDAAALAGQLRALGLSQPKVYGSMVSGRISIAGLKALLFRYTGQTDILIGQPLAGREQQRFRDLIGYFGGPVVLRARFSDDPSFAELLAQSQRAITSAHAHSAVSFRDVVEHLAPPRDPGRHPLFQVLCDVTAGPPPSLHGSELTCTFTAIELPYVAYDLLFTWQDMSDALRCSVEYNRSLWEPATIARMLGHLEQLWQGRDIAILAEHTVGDDDLGARLGGLQERIQVIQIKVAKAQAIGPGKANPLADAHVIELVREESIAMARLGAVAVNARKLRRFDQR